MLRTRSLASRPPLLLLAGLLGCSSVSAPRTAMTPQSRTVVSSGDRPVIVRDGKNDDAAALDLDRDEPPARAEGRISGRVIDDLGRPAPGVAVRVADGGSRSGRAREVTTDAAGAFTLRNLRPDASYTLIAEGSRGRAGRLRATPAGPRVTIRLRDTSDDATDGTADATEEVDDAPRTASARPRRIDRISGQSPIDDEAEPAAATEPLVVKAPPRRLNRDDLPPAAEIQAAAPAEASPTKVAWRKGASADPAVDKTEAPAPDPSPNLPEPKSANPLPDRPAAVPIPEAPAKPDDDGPNPLPPAKERPTNPEPPAETKPQESTPGDKPRDEASKPIEATEPAPKADPAPPIEPPANPFDPAENPKSTATAGTEAGLRAEAAPPGKTTWGDLAAREASIRLASSSAPPATSLPPSRRRLTDEERKAQESPPPSAKHERSRTTLLSRIARGRDDPRDAAVAPATCQLDARHNRIIDFRLPDIDGKPVRFQDLDADFVLLDFWGTWCEPCKASIPHLIELQTQYGPRTLRVVGIAAEKGTSFAEKSRLVGDTAKALGMNYPSLLSEADGQPCPLQEALHIQAYPTMVLLDREGHILYRDTGSRPISLQRLDKVIAGRVDTGVVRR